MGSSYVKLPGDNIIPWRNYVWRVIIGHFLGLIGWLVIFFLATGNWLHRWDWGVITVLGGAGMALGWGYLRKTKAPPAPPIDSELEEKLRQFGEFEREMNRKHQDFL